MRKLRWTTVLITLFMLNSGSVAAGEWRFPLGAAYISGAQEIVDQYEDNLQARGFITDSVDGIPIGISFQPYYEWDSGAGIGLGMGPIMLISGDVSFFNLPVNLCFRYTVGNKSNTSFYIKAGVSSNITNGDDVEDSQPGVLGAIGFEFNRNRAVAVGVEMAYNSSTIEILDFTTPAAGDTNEIEPTGITVGIFAVF